MTAHVVARRATLVAGAVLAVVALADARWPGLLGAVAGCLLVVGFLSSGLAPLLVGGPHLSAPRKALLLLLLFGYLLRLVLVIVVLVLLDRVASVDGGWLGGSILVCAVTWSTTHVAMVFRTSAT